MTESKTATRCSRSFLLVIGAIVALLTLFQFTTQPTSSAFRSFQVLQWNTLKGFEHGNAPVSLKLERGIYPEEGFSHRDRAYAVSAPFRVLSEQLEVEFSGRAAHSRDRAGLRFKLKDLAGTTLFDGALLAPRAKLHSKRWSSRRLILPAELVGKEVTATVVRQPSLTPPVELEFRDRILWFDAPNVFKRTAELPASRTIALFAAGLLAFALLVLCRSAHFAGLSTAKLLLLFFVVSFGVHFRISAFLFWDEIYLLEQFMRRGGFSGVIYRHNEHFLPLFFSWFYAQCCLFGDSYSLMLLVSNIIHALNGVLLAALLERLIPERPGLRTAARITALLFLISGLHAETMQWAFEQCLLLAQTATFLAMLAAIEFVRSGQARFALGAAAATAIAPLLFANGFIAAPQIALLLVLISHPLLSNRQRLLRTVTVLAVIGLATLIPIGLYLIFKKGVGSGIDNARPFEDLQKLFDYLLVGTQLGGVLRGLGLFPFFANTDPASLLTGPDRPEPLLATWGFLASLALLTYSLWKRPRGEAFRIWSLGQLIIITSMLLPAFGRWQYGMEQSLSLRYHYATIVGLAILLFPLLAGSALSTNIQKRRAAPTLGAALLILYFAVQLKAGNNYLVTPFGPTHRAYAAQLRDWNINLRALGAVTSYEAAGTALEGQHPLHPHSFTSQRHPDEVYRALNWLDPERYPWVDKNRYPVRTDL